MKKPHSPSADRNKEVILSVLKPEVSAGQLVLEIGSGTGQHVCVFGSALPDVNWQPTELENNISAINSWIAQHRFGNILEPIVLDVDTHPWPITSADVCFTCNTFHIVSMQSVRSIFQGCKNVLKDTGKLCVYGPFSIGGVHTSHSNALFDQQLRNAEATSGVRDLSELDNIAQQHGFAACRTTAMPANNLFVVWEREYP